MRKIQKKVKMKPFRAVAIVNAKGDVVRFPRNTPLTLEPTPIYELYAICPDIEDAKNYSVDGKDGDRLACVEVREIKP